MAQIIGIFDFIILSMQRAAYLVQEFSRNFEPRMLVYETLRLRELRTQESCHNRKKPTPKKMIPLYSLAAKENV